MAAGVLAVQYKMGYLKTAQTYNVPRPTFLKLAKVSEDMVENMLLLQNRNYMV